MYLSSQNKSFWESLHLKNGLEDWDMAEELKLAITNDQFLQATDEKLNHRMLNWQADPLAHWCSLPGKLPDDHEPDVWPHLWMWVNPSLVCPITGSPGMDLAGSNSPVALVTAATETSSPNTSRDYSNLDCTEEDILTSSSEAEKLIEDEGASRANIPFPQKMLETPKMKAMPVPQKSEVHRSQSMKLKYTRQMSTKVEGGWPRPPLNYCILITLALCNSANGSLTVQQIYQFTRQHFPFFQTAPVGWKNTIRHNLCFSSSFEKTTCFVCGNGNRKSCLWKLTPEGRKKFHEEAQALPKEALNLVRQSMREPGTFQKAGDLS